jgi:hypothetical protein
MMSNSLDESDSVTRQRPKRRALAIVIGGGLALITLGVLYVVGVPGISVALVPVGVFIALLTIVELLALRP